MNVRLFRQIALGLIAVLFSFPSCTVAEDYPQSLIGYTAGRNDDPRGQFFNWSTQRAWVVKADGSGPRQLAEALIQKPDSWTQFAGWSPDGQTAILGSHWESRENAAWEREHKTFRMTEGWLSDSCLVDLASGQITNLTAIDRVSIYNTGLFYLPDGSGFGFTPLINGISKPFVMDRNGHHKRDVSSQGTGFSYGYSASPDGRLISYHENYQVYVSNADGTEKKHIATGHPFNFAPRWSPDGEWLMFVAGEHYDCHPHVVRRDGTGLKKIADRGGYRGVVEVLKHPDFHSESSDLPVWSADSQSIFFTAKTEDRIELWRTTLSGESHQLTHSRAGTRHYHPAVSPDGRWLLFGSDHSGTMQLYVSKTDGSETWPITNVPEGHCAMHGHWQPAPQNPRN